LSRAQKTQLKRLNTTQIHTISNRNNSTIFIKKGKPETIRYRVLRLQILRLPILRLQILMLQLQLRLQIPP